MKDLFFGTILGVWLLAAASAAPYTVQPKDTLYSIGKKFNVPVAVLIRVNKLEPDSLRVGQIINIPEREHSVLRGETLFSIAKKYGTSVAAISSLNKLQNNALKVGQVLLIPWEASLFTAHVASSSSPAPSSSQSAASKPPSSSPVTPTPVPVPVKPVQISWRVEPLTVLPQLPPPERPASTFPTDANAARPKVWNLPISAPLPVLIVPVPSSPVSAEPIPLTQPSTAASTEPMLSYTVASGDTLFAIARRFGLTVGLLRQTNNLTSDSLRIGQVLVIPQADDLPTQKTLRAIAERYLGVDYVFGGSSANGLDCSGFTTIVFKEFGIALPRTSAQQFLTGQAVEVNDLQEGDLVFFDTLGKGTVSHVGIYLADNEFIHAASNPGKVLKSKLTEKYYATRYLGARRVVKSE